MTEIVYVPNNSSSNKYHTNPDCRYITDRHRERGREMMEAWGYEPCTLCTNGPVDTYRSNE